MPQVSVLMPVRNGERFLDEAVASLLGQTFRDFELVVVDDGSTDATPALLAAWAEHDRRVRVLTRPPSDYAHALRAAAEAAASPLLARLDADDVARPLRLQRQVERMRAEPALGLLGSDWGYIDDAGRSFRTVAGAILTHEDLVRRLVDGNAFCHSSVMMRAEAYFAVGGYRAFFTPAEDYDLWLRLSERWRVANHPEQLVDYRVHRKQVTAQRTDLAGRAVVLARSAALLRAAGEDEGDLDQPGADQRLLERAGLTEADQARQQFEFVLWFARLNARAGYPDQAAPLWSRAEELARTMVPSRPARSRVIREQARVAYEQGLRRKRVVLRLRAALLDPPAEAATIRRRLSGSRSG